MIDKRFAQLEERLARLQAERVELREMLGHVAGLLEDVHGGHVPKGAEGIARVCVDTTLRQVRRAGVRVRRIWGAE